MIIAIYDGDRRLGAMVLQNNKVVASATSPADQRTMDELLAPYTVLVNGEATEIDPASDPHAFIFYLRKMYHSGQGINVGNVED